jgi:hypothetical protein
MLPNDYQNIPYGKFEQWNDDDGSRALPVLCCTILLYTYQRYYIIGL